MNQARLAWAAFKNMLRAAARDPLWAFLSLLAMPFRVWKPLLQSFFILFVILFVVGLGGRMVLRDFGGFGPGSIPVIAWDGVTPLIMAATAFRLITAPLILHFGDMEGETHGSGRARRVIAGEQRQFHVERRRGRAEAQAVLAAALGGIHSRSASRISSSRSAPQSGAIVCTPMLHVT